MSSTRCIIATKLAQTDDVRNYAGTGIGHNRLGVSVIGLVKAENDLRSLLVYVYTRGAAVVSGALSQCIDHQRARVQV